MFLFLSLPVLLLCVVTTSCSATKACEDAQKTCSVVTCGIPVTNGTPGRDGREGPKGEKGEPGIGQAALTSSIFYPNGRVFSIRDLGLRHEEAHLSLW